MTGHNNKLSCTTLVEGKSKQTEPEQYPLITYLNLTNIFFLDRCHRIGQTRDVHIYRLISERSIEENIVKKANQKRLLGDLAIEGGNFTTAFFKKSTIKDLFDTNTETNETIAEVTELPDEETTNSLETISKKATKAFEKAIATVEDNTDLIVSCLFILSCSPDLTTNSKTISCFIYFSQKYFCAMGHRNFCTEALSTTDISVPHSTENFISFMNENFHEYFDLSTRTSF